MSERTKSSRSKTRIAQGKKKRQAAAANTQFKTKINKATHLLGGRFFRFAVRQR
jgi:hypothetical protein